MSDNKLGMIFPGQGSQSLGMLSDIAEAYPQLLETFEEASEQLSYDLWKLIQEGPEEKLSQTQITQPALLCSSVALWRLYESLSLPMPAVLAGHSLGEYSALVCAGVLSLKDGVKLVEQRGKYMQEAVPEGSGAMAAILGLEDQQVIDACNSSANSDVVSAVNFNAPGQVVIAGSSDAVERAINLCKEVGARKAMPLPVSVPSHCSLMAPAAERLSSAFNEVEFCSPKIDVINNVDVAIENDLDKIRDALIRQLTNPVRWVETIEKIHSEGVGRVNECGPGKVLAGLGKRIVKAMPTSNMNTLEGIEALKA